MIDLRLGDARDVLATLADGSVRCCVTSPPYYRLRDYGVDRQIGLEASLAEYLAALVAVFAEVKRVLTPDGTLWCNMGDSYAQSSARAVADNGDHDVGGAKGFRNSSRYAGGTNIAAAACGLGPKQLLGVPWRLAFALQDDGWILRSDCIWAKPNPMPESVKDRPTKAHEYVFLLSKSPRYFFDNEAIREPHATTETALAARMAINRPDYKPDHQGWVNGGGMITRHRDYHPGGRNARSVWSFPSEPFPGSHFATMPSALAARCVQAGTSERGRCPACSAPWVRVVERETVRQLADRAGTWAERPSAEGYCAAVAGGSKQKRDRTSGLSPSNSHHAGTPQSPRVVTTGWRPTCGHGLEPVPDVVLDPFAGAGTTLLAADRLHRDGLGIELNPAYREMALRRIASDEDLPLFDPPADRPPPPAWDGKGPMPGQLDLF